MEDVVNALAVADMVACAEENAVDQDPLVSVVIPCYNGEAFIQEAITSALTQTYQRVEVIVINDGSTDRSAEIIQALPVRYIHQENRGLTPSRNRGIEESRGSYIVFLDADDRLLPDAIETGLKVLQEHPECAMTIGDHFFVREDGSYLAPSHKEFRASAHYEALLISNFIEMISSVLFRRSVFEAVGAFDTRLRVAEDYELYLRIARDFPVCCHTAVVAEYRQHTSNVSHDSELMLTLTLQVLKREARHSFADIRRLDAFLQGLRTWRKRYGRQLTVELARSFSTLKPSDLLRKMLLLADYYPQGILLLFLLKLAFYFGVRKSGHNMAKLPVSRQKHRWWNAMKTQTATQSTWV
jgi:glycosyltransferase involved in cell wall biosynthesis